MYWIRQLITARIHPVVIMDQSASEMFQKLFRNLFEGRHCFIIVQGITLMVVAVNQYYLHGQVEQDFVVSTAVEAITFACLGLGSMAFITLPNPYSCRSLTDKHYTPKDIYSAAQ